MNDEKRWIGLGVSLLTLLAAAMFASVIIYQTTAAKSLSTGSGGWMRNGGARQLWGGPSSIGVRKQSGTGQEGKTSGRPSERFQPSTGEGTQPGKSFHRENGAAAPQPGSRMTGISRPSASRAAAAASTQQIAVAVYALLFFAGCAVWLFLRCRRKHPVKESSAPSGRLIIGVLAAGFCLRVAMAPWLSGHLDLTLFQNWANSAASGLTTFYESGNSDYPPLYIYVLAVIGKLAVLPGLSGGYTWLLKLPAIICDCLTAYLLQRIGVRLKKPFIGAVAGLFYLLNPAVLLDSTFWGQVDSMFALLVVLAVWLLAEKKVAGAVTVFALSVMMKPQGLIFLPILAYALLKQRRMRTMLASAILFIAVIVVTALPFSFHASGGALWLVKLFQRTTCEYPFASINAFNVWGLLGANYRADTATPFLFSYRVWGIAAIVIVSLLSLWMVWRRSGRETVVSAALLQISGVFTFSSGMHERYLFPAIALALLAALYARHRLYFALASALSLTTFMNIFIVYYDSLSNVQNAAYSWPLISTALLNVGLFAGVLGAARRPKNTREAG
ncbi:MAG: glycosyltransferase 87 family protein [Sporolactobacillus sp.]